MSTTLEMINRLKRTDVTGDLGNASTADLEAYAAALCHPSAFGEFGDRQFPQICETVRVHLLRAHIENLQGHVIELHEHITNLNASNTKLQKLVVALTIASLIGTGAQVWFAVKADKTPEEKSPISAPQPQKPIIQLIPSIPVPNTSAGQVTKKRP